MEQLIPKRAQFNPLSYVFRFLISLVMAFIPAMVSIYDPHKLYGGPTFMAPAVKNVAVFTVIVVPVMWLLARKWSLTTLQRIFVAGLVLTGLALIVTSIDARGTSLGGVRLLTFEIAGSIAIPCVSIFGLLIGKKREDE